MSESTIESGVAFDDDAPAAPSRAVLEAVADAEGTSQLTLEPLYDVIDPDALDALFQDRTDGTVTFSYHGYRVAVEAGGDVTLVPQDE